MLFLKIVIFHGFFESIEFVEFILKSPTSEVQCPESHLMIYDIGY